MPTKHPSFNTNEAQRKDLESALPSIEAHEKATTQDITREYLKKLKSDVRILSPKQINAFLQKQTVQASITKFRSATPETLATIGIKDKQRLLTAAVFYHTQLLGSGPILNNPDKYKFATKLTDNTILDSNNHSVISNLLMPLFGKLKVVTQKGNLIMRDKSNKEIGKLKPSSEITLDITAQPNHYSKQQGSETHLYLAAKTSDGTECYLAAEFLDASMNSTEFNEFFATGAQSDAMQASLEMYDLYNQAPQAHNELSRLIDTVQDTVVENSGVNEAVRGALAAQVSLKSIIDMTDASKTANLTQSMQELKAEEPDESVLSSLRGTLKTTRQAMQQAEQAKIRLQKQLIDPTRLSIEDDYTSSLSGSEDAQAARDHQEQLAETANTLELDSIGIAKLNDSNSKIDELISQKFINNPKAFIEEVNDSILGESPLSVAEDNEYIKAFATALARARTLLIKSQTQIIENLQAKQKLAIQNHKHGPAARYFKHIEHAQTKQTELTKQMDDLLTKLTIEVGTDW